jgi:hypothetical protein
VLANFILVNTFINIFFSESMDLANEVESKLLGIAFAFTHSLSSKFYFTTLSSISAF